MASSLFGTNSGNSVLNAVNAFRSLGNPQAVYQQFYNTNPQFRQFADSMQGKTPEQAFRENGLDFNQFRNLM